jgi:hypothetical protein
VSTEYPTAKGAGCGPIFDQGASGGSPQGQLVVGGNGRGQELGGPGLRRLPTSRSASTMIMIRPSSFSGRDQMPMMGSARFSTQEGAGNHPRPRIAEHGYYSCGQPVDPPVDYLKESTKMLCASDPTRQTEAPNSLPGSEITLLPLGCPFHSTDRVRHSGSSVVLLIRAMDGVEQGCAVEVRR